MTDQPCPNCGTSVAADVSLCPKCGERLLNPFPPGSVAPPASGPAPFSGTPPGFIPPTGPTQPAGYSPSPGFVPPGSMPEGLDPRQGMGSAPGFNPPPSIGPPGMPPAGFDPRLGMDPRQSPAGYGVPPGGMYPQSPHGYPPVVPVASKQKTTAGILAILVGSLGVHFFYLGQRTWGLVFLLGTVLSCGIGALITTPVSIVQGILYLCATDEDFYQKYVVQKRMF